MVNYIPELSGYSGQGAFRYWCQKVLPLVYDDSLSYYELLNKVVSYLNNTIEDVAKAEGNIDSLLTAYTQLQTYVNDYFDNLDVQEEINNKLDAMAESGELSDLLEPFIPALVTSWLNEHITPTSPIVDNSLSISGAAADAKVTGDELAKTVMASEKYIEHSNLQGYTDADGFENNRIFLISSDVEETDIANLPNYNQLGYVLTLTANIAISDTGVQLYYSSTKSFMRRKRLGVWSDWREYANYNDVLKYQVFEQADYSSLADFPINTSHIVNTYFADAPDTASNGALITMRFSPNNKLQVFFAQTGTQGIYYRIVNFSDPTNLYVSEWRSLYSTPNNLNASGITIEHSNLQGFTSLDDLEANKIYCIASDLLMTDIANLPYEGELAYIFTFQSNTEYNVNGIQLYISATKTFTRRKRLGVWSDWREYADNNVITTIIDELKNYVYSNIGNMIDTNFDYAGGGNGTVTEITPVDLANNNIKKAYSINVVTAPFGIRTAFFRLIQNETYTMKCWAKGNGGLRLNCGGNFVKDIPLTNEWEEYEFTFINSLETGGQKLYFANYVDNSEIEVAGISFKVADETLSPIYNEVILKGDWEYGSIGTLSGDLISDNTRIRSRIFMSFPDVADDKIIITIPAGYGINYRIYNEDETFDRGVSGVIYAENNDIEKYINVRKDKKYKFVVFPYNGETINLVDFSKTNIKIKYNTFENKPVIRILSIGNSHTRDAVRYVQHILSKNGYRAELGHYYWGGSTLKQQYEALDFNINPNTVIEPSTDPDISTDNFPKTGAFYRCYNDYGVYTSVSNSETAYNRMTLVNAVYDKPWDIVIYQQQTNRSAEYNSYFSSEFNFNDFIKLVNDEISNDNIKIGIMAVHTRSATFTGDNVTPKELEEGIQETTAKVAKEMSQCDFIVNTGLAIKYSRGNEYLRMIGNDMCRTDDWGVHLDDPVPQYIASLTYAMTVCGDSIANADSYPDSFTDDDRYLGYLGKRYAKYATLNVDNLLDFDNDKIYNTYITRTVEGNPIVIEDGAINVPLQHLTVSPFNGVIEGTGTPSLSNIYHFIPVTSTDITINGTTHHIEFRTGLYSNGSYDAIEGLTYDNKRFVEFDGTENWVMTFTDENQFPAFYLNVDTYGNAVNNGGQFNILPSLTSLTGDNGAEGGRVYVSGAGNVIVICRFSNLFTTLTDFKNYLKTLKQLGTPLQVLYTLSNIQSHVEEKINENDNSGEWNLSTTATNMSATYRVDTKTYNETNIFDSYITENATGNPATFTDGGDNIPVKSLIADIDTVQQGSGTPSISNPRLFTPKTSVTITHNNTSLSIPFGTVVGNVYGGTLNVTTGELKVTHRFVEFDGSETWYRTFNNEENNKYAFYCFLDDTGNTVNNSGVFSILPPATSISAIAPEEGARVYVYNSTTRIICRFINQPDNVEDFKTYLAGLKTAGTPLQTVYTLATPQVYRISENEVRTLLGANSISADTGEVNVVYRADTKLYIQEQLA